MGADMVGRMATILVDMPMDAGAWGYRLSGRRSAVARRAADFLSADLDAVEELWDAAGFIGTGRPFKIQVCGPFTFAASAELANGHKILRDKGAWSDVIASATEGIGVLAAETERRLGARVVVQLDEPSIGSVIDGTVRPLTRFDTIAAIPVAEVADALGALLDGGGVLMAGLVSTTAPASAGNDTSRAELVASAAARIIDRIGLNRSVLRDNVVITPTCGLAGAGAGWARSAASIAAKAGELLTDFDAL
jgi:hypothetical protein